MQQFINVPPQFHQGNFPKLIADDFLKEPSLHHCGIGEVYGKGGMLARSALFQIQEKYKREIELASAAGLSAMVDVNVLKLMPDVYSDIPGWHCDSVPRHSYTGEPEFDAVNTSSFNVKLSLSTEAFGVSHDEYVSSRMAAKIWAEKDVFSDLSIQTCTKNPEIYTSRDGMFIKYSPKTITRPLATLRRGYKFIFKFCMISKPPIANLINQQQQVYLYAPIN